MGTQLAHGKGHSSAAPTFAVYGRRLCPSLRPYTAAHVYCGQMAGWIKTPLGTEVCLGPGGIVLDGDPARPHGKGHRNPHFSSHVCCGQTVAHPSNCWTLVDHGNAIPSFNRKMKYSNCRMGGWPSYLQTVIRSYTFTFKIWPKFYPHLTSPPVDNIWAVMTIWRIKGKIITTVLHCAHCVSKTSHILICYNLDIHDSINYDIILAEVLLRK